MTSAVENWSRTRKHCDLVGEAEGTVRRRRFHRPRRRRRCSHRERRSSVRWSAEAETRTSVDATSRFSRGTDDVERPEAWRRPDDRLRSKRFASRPAADGEEVVEETKQPSWNNMPNDASFSPSSLPNFSAKSITHDYNFDNWLQ